LSLPNEEYTFYRDQLYNLFINIGYYRGNLTSQYQSLHHRGKVTHM